MNKEKEVKEVMSGQEGKSKCENCGLAADQEETLCPFCKEYGKDGKALADIRLFVTKHLSILQERMVSDD